MKKKKTLTPNQFAKREGVSRQYIMALIERCKIKASWKMPTGAHTGHWEIEETETIPKKDGKSNENKN